ncbi:MAG: primosomal protein N' [candidate division KSB1 bacterium]|nr:primosomal protein N' [candidate division KSB1 bacterium]
MPNNTPKPFAQVVFPVAVQRAFTYIVPERFYEDALPGVRVLCPFGPRKTTGFVIDRVDTTDVPKTKLKEIEEVLDPVPLFTPAVLQTAKWIADYYLCGWGEALKAALPPGINIDSERLIRLTHPKPDELAEFLQPRAPRQAEIILRLAAQNSMSVRRLEKAMGISIYSPLKTLRQKGLVRMELSLPGPKARIKYEVIVKLSSDISYDDMGGIIHDLHSQAPKQAQVLECLMAMEVHELARSDLYQATGVNRSSLKSLLEKGYISEEKREVLRDYYDQMQVEKPVDLTLNSDQQQSLSTLKSALDTGSFQTLLLYGVTGSGKTQVYIEALHHALKKGKTAIVMVPEIALTPQTVRRFRAHFGDKVAVFHSRMSAGERYDSWRKTWEGEHTVVIGPRSAIFAPLRNVGLIVIDEEHEPSYKQTDQSPRYHARDVAVMRAVLENAVCLLGSATPSVESYYNVHSGKYNLLQLPQRIDNVPMPEVRIVDMKREPRIIGRTDPIIFSRMLREKIEEKLNKGEQIILFLNRRGFATLFKCKDCGYLAKCEHCDITLTYHLRGQLLKCHYCGYTRKSPDTCPECNGTDVFLRGIGTQRVEEELHTLFPGVDCLRMDVDTTRGRRAHDKVLARFASGQYPILLGTQMVAKGLDFPNVTLVGVISADTELLFPDFRSAERTFQLLTQVAGRAGRKDKLGQVIIQTFSPDHYSLQYAKKHDYDNFFKSELFDRRKLNYPPYSRVINVLFRGEDEAKVEQTAVRVAEYIPAHESFRMLGPAPAPLSRIQNNYRWQILLMGEKEKDASGRIMKQSLKTGLETFHKNQRRSNVSIAVDVDPSSIL